MRRRGVSAWSGHLADLMCLLDFSENVSAAFCEFLEAFFCAQAWWSGFIGLHFGFVDRFFMRRRGVLGTVWLHWNLFRLSRSSFLCAGMVF